MRRVRTSSTPATRTDPATRDPATRISVGGGPYGIDGGFFYHPSLTDGEMALVLDDYAELGWRLVIATAINRKTTDCSTDDYLYWSGMPTKLGTLLDLAHARGMQVYVGLVESSNVCATFYETPNRTHDIAQTTTQVTAVLASYGSHPALAGWYIVNEQALPYEQRVHELTEGKAYYLGIRNAIRALSALPIIVAPYLGNVDGQSIQTPAQVATRVKDFIDNTGGDLIIALQDSLGADGINLAWARSGDRAHPMRQYYDAIAGQIGAAQLWSINEVFTYPTTLFTGSQYRAALACRVARQIAESQGASRHVTWLSQAHMGRSDDDRRIEADRLYASWRALNGFAGEYVRPTYTWNSTPESARPDRGGAMTDLMTGDPRDVTDDNWVGFPNGGCQLVADMGSSKTLKWAALGGYDDGAGTYRVPSDIKIETSPNGTDWTDQGTTSNTYGGTQAEYVLSNTTPLSVTCRYVRLTTTNPTNKTLVGEMEIICG